MLVKEEFTSPSIIGGFLSLNSSTPSGRAPVNSTFGEKQFHGKSFSVIGVIFLPASTGISILDPLSPLNPLLYAI